MTAAMHLSHPGWIARVWERNESLWPLRAGAERFSGHASWPSVVEIDVALSARAGVRFLAQAPKPRGRHRRRAAPSYDSTICEHGVVPTRPRSWHDLFNALVWATFPHAKRALHERQHRARALALEGAGGAPAGGRTREQDGLALVDEGGVALLCSEASVAGVRAALDARDEPALARSVAGGDALGLVFGHAVYEHLAAELPPVRAMVHVVECSAVPATQKGCVDLADSALAASLLDPRSFAHPDTFRSFRATSELLGPPPAA